MPASKHTRVTNIDVSIQYSAITILLNRHNAGFGDSRKRCSPRAVRSRRDCIEHAARIARLLDDYKSQHGKAFTIIGSGLYNITMAATTLVADISEKDKASSSSEPAYLTTCLQAMKEMENAEIVARNVRKIVQTIMRVCNVRRGGEPGKTTASFTDDFEPENWELNHRSAEMPAAIDQSANGSSNNAVMLNFDTFDMDGVFPFPFEDALPNPTSTGDFASLDSCFGNV